MTNYSYMRFLADEIIKYTKLDFKDVHLSGNLMDTIKIEEESLDKIVIRIPAKTYDMYKYLKEKVIVYTNTGSYASRLNEEGSYIFKKYIGNHIRYMDAAIAMAIVSLQSKVEADGNEILKEQQ